MIPAVKSRSKKRLGRGYGSGKGGHTSSRGQKGQKSRGGVGILFEGLKVRKSLLNRLPFLRGKGKFKAQRKPVIVDLVDLNSFKAGATVTVESLAEQKLVSLGEAKTRGVKIVGSGKLEKKLTVMVPVTQNGKLVIEKAGGQVEQK